jgi:hypothetical protein
MKVYSHNVCYIQYMGGQKRLGYPFYTKTTDLLEQSHILLVTVDWEVSIGRDAGIK